jgi:hypothetical protein
LRVKNKLDNAFVIGVLRIHDSDLDANIAQDLRNRGFGAYPYVLVMTGGLMGIKSAYTIVYIIRSRHLDDIDVNCW